MNSPFFIPQIISYKQSRQPQPTCICLCSFLVSSFFKRENTKKSSFFCVGQFNEDHLNFLLFWWLDGVSQSMCCPFIFSILEVLLLLLVCALPCMPCMLFLRNIYSFKKIILHLAPFVNNKEKMWRMLCTCSYQTIYIFHIIDLIFIFFTWNV